MVKLKDTPRGEWLQCKEGNMPEDYGYETWRTCDISQTVLVPTSGYSFIDGTTVNYIPACRVRTTGNKRWHWMPKIDPPLFWMVIPKDFDTSHIQSCDSLDAIWRVVNGTEPPNGVMLSRDQLERWKNLFTGLADNAKTSSDRDMYRGKLELINELFKMMEKS